MLILVMAIAGGAVGLFLGVLVGRRTIPGNAKPLGKLFIERIDVEPYVTGCWLGIEKQDEIKRIKKDGQLVSFIVSITHPSD